MDGQRVTGAPPSQVGYVFQKDTVFPWRTVERNIALGLEYRNVPAAERAARVREAIALAGLQGFEDALPGHALGRHAAARGPDALAGGGSRDPADGRALRRARHSHQAEPARRAAGDLAGEAADRDLRHARSLRGDHPGRPHRGDDAPARPHQADLRREAAAPPRRHPNPREPTSTPASTSEIWHALGEEFRARRPHDPRPPARPRLAAPDPGRGAGRLAVPDRDQGDLEDARPLLDRPVLHQPAVRDRRSASST